MPKCIAHEPAVAGLEVGPAAWPAPRRVRLLELVDELRVHNGTVCGTLPLTFTAAPGEEHMVHMPARIYIRVGRWNDAVTANQHAIHTDEVFSSRRTTAMRLCPWQSAYISLIRRRRRPIECEPAPSGSLRVTEDRTREELA